MRKIKKGSTDRSVILRAIDSTDGTPETGIAYDTTGIDLWYRRNGGAVTSITEVTLAAVDSAHSDGGVIHIGNGYFRLDSPDAAFATGADSVMFGGTATGMIIIGQEIQLVNYDPEDGVRLGLTALPNAAADAAGGLAISDAGGLDLDAKLANTNEVTAARMGALTDWINGGRLDLLIDAIKAQTDLFTAARAGALTDLIDGGRLDLLIDAIKAATDLVTAARMGALTDLIDGGRLDLILDAILTDTGTTLDGLIDAIKVVTDQFVFTVANKVDATATVTGGDATAANQTTIIGHLTDIKGGTWTDETLVTLQTAVEAIGGLTGSNAVTLTIQAPSGTNIVGATVDVFDSGNTTFIGRLTTDSSGQVSFSADDGTYIIRIIKAGYVFTNQTLVVNGVEAETYTGTAYSPSAPAAASICRVYEYAYDPDGTPMSIIKAYAKINTLPYDANSVLYAGQNITAEYNSTTGLLYWDLVQGSSVKFTIKDLGIDEVLTVPASSTVRLSDI